MMEEGTVPGGDGGGREGRGDTVELLAGVKEGACLRREAVELVSSGLRGSEC